MAEYTPNSHKYKAEQKEANEKRADKVVKGVAKTKKKSEIRKFADVFVAEDVSSVKTYVLSDVVVPAVKKLVFDIVRDGMEMLMYGGTGRGDRKRSDSGYISYARYSDDRRDGYRPTTSSVRSRFDFDEIVFPSRGEAEAVLNEMNNVLHEYGIVRVADLYDMAGLSQPYTSNRYGWTGLRNAEVVRVRDGYEIKLPKAMPID